MELGPPRARERPLVLGALDELLARVADLQQHARVALPAGLLALQVMAEELLLHGHAVAGIEVRPVRVAVHLEPLVLGAGIEVSLDVAARVQALAAPVAVGEHRNVDLRPVGCARAPEVVVELVLEREAPEVEAVGMELLFGQRLRAAYPVAGQRAAVA